MTLHPRRHRPTWRFPSFLRHARGGVLERNGSGPPAAGSWTLWATALRRHAGEFFRSGSGRVAAQNHSARFAPRLVPVSGRCGVDVVSGLQPLGRGDDRVPLFAAGIALGTVGDFFNGGSALQDLVPAPGSGAGGIAAYARWATSATSRAACGWPGGSAFAPWCSSGDRSFFGKLPAALVGWYLVVFLRARETHQDFSGLGSPSCIRCCWPDSPGWQAALPLADRRFTR